MKRKKLNKLSLNKSTVAHLGDFEKKEAKGGYLPTHIEETCYTWCGACLTRASCVATCNYSCNCVTNDTCDPRDCETIP